MNVWEEIKQALAGRLSADGFQNWIQPTQQERVEGRVVWVGVPNTATAEYIELYYRETVSHTIRDLRLPVDKVVYQLRAPAGHGNGGGYGNTGGYGNGNNYGNGHGRDAVPVATEAELFSNNHVHLNPKFTFDHFVVGSCNQFAHAAAQAVSTNPSKSYNPLFIYGGVGMGKTHLMHAIGRALQDRFTGLRLVYTTSERFMNQMVNCIKLDRMREFHAHYRTADILLVDDIQILGNKERTQEEFFHTFNELFDHQKQIVLSSDQPPKSTPGLVERLRSRFEWGLIVDVQAPDLETKMAILDKKSEADGIHLPEDVRIFIATKTKSNVRELEGALVKLIAYSSVTGTPITLDMAKQTLKYLTAGHEKRITIDSIIRSVAEHWGMPHASLKQKSNERRIAYPRQVAMYLAKDLTQASLPEIGRAFGGKHHTTVLHSIQKIESLRQRDVDLNRTIQSLTDSIHG